MLSDEPFPLDLFPSGVREAVLSEFKGRHPTNLQVARVSDAHWLGCPRIGPTMLARMRSVTRRPHQRPRTSSVGPMTDAELLRRFELLQDELEPIRGEIKESATELWARGIVPPAMAIRQLSQSSGLAVHQELG
jgi:hypothetical protein